MNQLASHRLFSRIWNGTHFISMCTRICSQKRALETSEQMSSLWLVTLSTASHSPGCTCFHFILSYLPLKPTFSLLSLSFTEIIGFLCS